MSKLIKWIEAPIMCNFKAALNTKTEINFDAKAMTEEFDGYVTNQRGYIIDAYYDRFNVDNELVWC